MENRIDAWFLMKDKEYENKLCAFLQYHYGHRINARHFDDFEPGACLDAVLLYDEETEAVQNAEIKAKLKLTEGDSSDGVDRYQSGHVIARMIMDAYSQIEYENFRWRYEDPRDEKCFESLEQDRHGKKMGQVWSVYSPTGGVGKTTFALTVANTLLREESENVLYLNLENIPSYLTYFNRQEYTLSDLLYEILMDRGDEVIDEEVNLVAVKEASGLFTIAPCPSFEDVVLLRREEINVLLNALRRRFDYIVCDFDTSFWGPTEKFLCQSDRIFLIWNEYAEGDERRKAFECKALEIPRIKAAFCGKVKTVGYGYEVCTKYEVAEVRAPITISSDGFDRFYAGYPDNEYTQSVKKIVEAVLDEIRSISEL